MLPFANQNIQYWFLPEGKQCELWQVIIELIFFFSGGGTFFFFCVSPNIFIYFFLATMFNPSNNKASLASSQFYVTRYNKWTYSVRLITLLIVNFLFLWPFTITAINTFLEGSDFHFHYIRKQWLQATGKNRTYYLLSLRLTHFLKDLIFIFTTLENNDCRLLAKIERTCLMSATTPTSRSSQQNVPFAKSYFITLLSIMVYKIRGNQFSLSQAIGKQGSLHNCWGIS